MHSQHLAIFFLMALSFFPILNRRISYIKIRNLKYKFKNHKRNCNIRLVDILLEHLKMFQKILLNLKRGQKTQMTIKFSFRFLATTVFCLLLGLGQVFAQSQASSGQISGTVTDSAGAAVPNATVKIVGKSTGVEKTTTSNDNGDYRFLSLRPGVYTVTANGSGFSEQSLEATVNIGRSSTANFALGVGDVSAVVNVTGEEVQTTVSQPDSVLTNTDISKLPLNGRRFQDLATLTPNVEIDPQRGQLSIGGQKGIDLAINVDGGDFAQPFFGGISGGERSNFSFTLPQEAVQEFQVVSAGYSAEFGRATGGIINVVTKGGTKRFWRKRFHQLPW